MDQPDFREEPRLIGASAAHRQVMETLDLVAPIDAEILITGPTGVGKELYANYVHQRSPRAGNAFVAVNCGGLPRELIENELFGHIGGAFTGARLQSAGLIAEAEGGTLFLDEVDSLPLDAQAKLLRFIQEKEYRRLGETRLRHADLRIVAATNADLVGAVREKRFRQDLYYRLRVVPIDVPALVERPEDIPLLLAAFAIRYAKAYGLAPVTFSNCALEKLRSYSWPGNVRELENCVKYLTCMQLARTVEIFDLPLERADEPDELLPLTLLVESGDLKTVKREVICLFERVYLESALRRCDGNIAAAARASGKARRAFFELMRKHGLTGCQNSSEHKTPPS
ncbi:Transcriptional regulatory protein QseF [Paraburkholderia ultramafica]|uniref:Transcriptional regulatory protein QseF n=1 Tax=Paraburkholderia ultramafica TaxID=1544867 RepID=A0A6S7B297_9BURK|nr:sigma-54 dependent transcriptional regulator [Paraburkholderia ultramafica]CAB3778796.1 Transcriptional regulatory protein QseF [Paraburkholderia ultramafica]